MRIDPDRSTLVIVGAWNQAIFSPQWVHHHLMPGPTQVTAEVGLTPGGLIPRFTGPLFLLAVHSDRTIWRPHAVSDANLMAEEEAASKLLELLAETPVSAIGINFGFDVEAGESDLLARVLAPADNDRIAGLDAAPRSILVKRQLLADPETVNLAIAREEDAAVRIDLNFHRDVARAADARAMLPGAIRSRRDQALGLLERLYSLRLENE